MWKKKVTRLTPKKIIKKRLTLISTIELRFPHVPGPPGGADIRRAAPAATSCYAQDKCYQMISTEADFNTAKQRCETSGAVLAEIHSDITEQLLASLVPQGPDWSTPRKWVFADIWLGAQSDEEGALKWDINDVPVLSGFNRMREAITPSKCLFQNEEVRLRNALLGRNPPPTPRDLL